MPPAPLPGARPSEGRRSLGKCYPGWRCRRRSPVCRVCAPPPPPDPPDRWPPFSPPSLRRSGHSWVPRRVPQGCPGFAAPCPPLLSAESLGCPSARPYRCSGAGGRLPVGAVAFPASPGGAELPAEVPGAQTKQSEAAGGELQGWVCGDGAGWEPHGGSVQGETRSPAPQPSQPFLPAPTRPLHGHPGKCQRTGLGRGEGQMSGQKPAPPGAAWSRDACPLLKGRVGGAG